MTSGVSLSQNTHGTWESHWSLLAQNEMQCGHMPTTVSGTLLEIH